MDFYPKKIEGLDTEVIVDVVCGDHCMVAFTASDKAHIFGASGDKEIRSGKDIISTSFNYDNTWGFVGAFVTQAGQLYTWGRGYTGCLGHGDRLDQSAPKLVEALTGVVCKQVACGGDYTLVVTQSGQVYEIGEAKYDALQGKDWDMQSIPTLVKALETIDIKEVQCGLSFAVALSTTGYVYTWGNFNGTLGSPPRLVKELREHNVVHLSCSWRHCAVLVDPTPCHTREAQKPQFKVLNKYRVKDLKEMLRARGLKVSGKKSELIERLQAQ